MDDRLLSSLELKENRCRNLQRQANEVLNNNGREPSEDQCRLLQQAADIEAEMAQLTIGAEKNHHIREKNRLDYEIMKIRGELDRKAGKKPVMKDPPDDGKEDKNKDNKAKAPAKSKDEEELERTVRTWYKEAPRHSFEDVSGMAELKKKLQSCIFDSQAERLTDYLGIPKLNSYFFVGPPGCGKTYIIEAFAHELMDKDYKYMSLQGSDIISKYVGAAEKNVTRLFEEAEKNAPCIVFIDEIDSLCKNRSLPNLPEYAANITTSFLTGYNRIHSMDSKVIFIAATNYPNRVDNAMLDRAEVVRVPLPDKDAREAAFEKSFKNIVTLKKGLTYEMMAEATRRYNYRDIERLTTAVKRLLFKEVLDLFKDQDKAVDALKTGKYKLTANKFKEIVSKFKPSPKESIIRDLKQWEKSIKSVADYDDTDIETVYDAEAYIKADSKMVFPAELEMEEQKLEAESEEPVSEERTEDQPKMDPVYLLKDAYMVDPLTGMVEVEFGSGVGELNLSDAFVSIDGEISRIKKSGDHYSFEYTPDEDETDFYAVISSSQGELGTLAVFIGKPISDNSDFDI